MSKSVLKCVGCEDVVSKYEAEFVDETTFEYAPNPPPEISLGTYCVTCFERAVKPALQSYENQVEQARNVNVFFAKQSKESRFVRRVERAIEVKDCADREDAVLQLAFQAVQLGKNILVDVDLTATKVYNGNWKSSRWHGRAIPASVDEAYLQRRDCANPNN